MHVVLLVNNYKLITMTITTQKVHKDVLNVVELAKEWGIKNPKTLQRINIDYGKNIIDNPPGNLPFMEDVVNLLEVNWYYLDAAIVDDVSKNIFLRSDMGFETSLIQAESVDGQVCIVPVPFTARRLAKNYNSSSRTLPTHCLDRPDFLSLVLDRRADFFGDIGDDEAED